MAATPWPHPLPVTLDSLDCSDPLNVEKRRQPFPDPWQLFPSTWAHPLQRPNWALPYEMPVPVDAPKPPLRAEDI